MSKNEPAPFSFIENGGGSGLCKNDREPLPFLQILEHDAWMNMKKTILNWKVVVDSLLWCDFMSELHILIMVALMLPMFYFPAAAQNQKTYDIEVSGISPVLFLDIWDYDAEDHDRVKVTLNGTIISAFEITHTPKKVTIPLVFVDGEAIVEIVGTYSGRGDVTYAVRATGIGTGVEIYKHRAGVGSGNSYRIVKKEDFLTKLWNSIWGNDIEDDSGQPVLTKNRTKEFRDLAERDQRKIIKYAMLSYASYEDENEYLVKDIVHSERKELESGLFSNVYKDRNGDIIISFRGTDDYKDWMSNFAVAYGNNSTQRKEARELIKKYIEQYPGQVVLVGHSLGGYLATSAALGLADKLKAVYAYNAPGIDVGVSKHFNENEIKALVGKTTQVYHKNDIVHTVGIFTQGVNYESEDVHFENRVKVTGYYGFWDKYLPWNNNHSILKLIKRMRAEYEGSAYY